jgi:hypothetical protein
MQLITSMKKATYKKESGSLKKFARGTTRTTDAIHAPCFRPRQYCQCTFQAVLNLQVPMPNIAIAELRLLVSEVMRIANW